ncbi:MAG: sodium-dependent transporter [Clostridiaceae bacterium]|jgi:NSS family neurotransmitter:Na+ symporter|nr:sodium-dependent transporter [Clostridiaceae bacterium]
MSQQRESFTSRIGFILAAAGSAVGLGNLWRFPYLAAQQGGGVFLLVYILFALTFGLSLLITEVAIGRRTRLSAMSAYTAMHPKFSFLGVLAMIVPTIILSYYCVIGGWVTKYGYEFIVGSGQKLAEQSEDYFNTFITMGGRGLIHNAEFWFIIFLGVTAVIILFGVQKGIEIASKIMMPLLIIISVGIVVYVLTIPGVANGLKYYLVPDFSFISSFKDFTNLLLLALGQLFYSLSLAMAIMITYGSYMKQEDDLQKSSAQIVALDTFVAFLAGLMIIPPVVAYSGGDPTLIRSQAGPGLMFVTLPKVFADMPAGNIVGAAFFILVFFAALTSSISLMEAVVSIVMDVTKIKRTTATLTVIGVSVLIGTLSCLGYGPLAGIQIIGRAFLDFFDFITNSVMMPIVAIFTCILVGHVVKPDYIEHEVLKSGNFRAKKAYEIMIKWIAIPMLVVILLSNLFA